MSTITREQWLERASGMMATTLFDRIGHSLPRVRVSVGFPGGGSARKRIGECWNPRASSDGVSQVFISPVLVDGVRVLDVLAHELIHAIVPEAGHKAPFKRIALAIGLTGKMTATEAGPELRAQLTAMLCDLGEYPHAALSLGMGKKKQTTRMLKLECVCGFICRSSQGAIDEHGVPAHCDEPMRLNASEEEAA